MHRRTVVAAGLASLVPTLGAGRAGAADWPERPVHIVVPYAPGGPVDLVARLIGDKLGA
jgi:tripartite-type tricarboxylate transporter receptor subunit TctC